MKSENNGILIIDKEAGFTSRDVINALGKAFHTKKIGHTGTLDPLATGVLVVCLNKATKIAEVLTSLEKEYIAHFKFGLLTDTLDVTGKVLREENTEFSKEQINEVLKTMLGEYMQEVPLYSAVKVKGKKLYEYARNNEEVALPFHKVNIKQLELLDLWQEENKTVIKVRCLVSKGTYIRALGNDIAAKLGTHASMQSLRRTKQGKFSIEESYTLEDIKNGNYSIKNIEEVLDFPKVEVEGTLKNKIINGALIDNEYQKDIILFTYHKKALALYKKYDKDYSKLKPWKMF